MGFVISWNSKIKIFVHTFALNTWLYQNAGLIGIFISIMSFFREVWKQTWNVCLPSLIMMLMMMNCFCGIVDRRKAFSLISSRGHCQRSSPSRIYDTPQAGFDPTRSLNPGFTEWSCVVVIATTPRRQ